MKLNLTRAIQLTVASRLCIIHGVEQATGVATVLCPSSPELLKLAVPLGLLFLQRHVIQLSEQPELLVEDTSINRPDFGYIGMYIEPRCLVDIRINVHRNPLSTRRRRRSWTSTFNRYHHLNRPSWIFASPSFPSFSFFAQLSPRPSRPHGACVF